MKIPPTSAKLNKSSDHDDEERQELGVGEDVLNEGGPLHLPAVDEGQHTCKKIWNWWK